MKLAKAPQAEIDALFRWLQSRDTAETDPKDRPPKFMRVVFGYETLVNNCCDPAKDYLEFKPELLAAKEDAKRLDWLEKNRPALAANISRNAISTPTLRVAIDAEIENPS